MPLAALDDVTNGLTDFAPPQIEPMMLTNATGRVSLRIDLPKSPAALPKKISVAVK